MTDKKPVKVAVNGYGVIGKRVADAVAVQADMSLVGVADVATDWRAWMPGEGDELFYAYMVDNQAIVIPETIDAIRALTNAEPDGTASIERTNTALGVGAFAADAPAH